MGESGRTDGSFVHSPTFDAVVLRGLFQANVLSLLLKERMISPELVERMKDWRNEGFHAFAGEEIPDTSDALRVGLYVVRGPAATSRLRADPAQKPSPLSAIPGTKVRFLTKGTVPDYGEERVSSGHRDYDYLARRKKEFPISFRVLSQFLLSDHANKDGY
jgi:hypothetical protein